MGIPAVGVRVATLVMVASFTSPSLSAVFSQAQAASTPVPITGDEFANGAYRAGPGIQAPVAKKKVPPKYTMKAAFQDLSGEVSVDLLVGTDGKVKKTRVAKSLDLKYGLDDAATKALKQWTFQPGRLNGAPVPCLVSVIVEFRNPLFAPAGFDTDALDPEAPGVTQPVLKHKADPRYSSEAMRALITGEVWLDAVVDVDGSVKVLRIKRSLDKEYGLDYAAIQASKEWRFQPATRNGLPVKCRVVLIMEFRLH